MTRARAMIALTLAASCMLLCGFAADGYWLRHVPESARKRKNPLAGQAVAIEAGRKLYGNHCASCHGVDANGRGKRPSLHSERVHHATDGELSWLLQNGDLSKGMPSWSKLPDQQRWQLISYIRSLPE